MDIAFVLDDDIHYYGAGIKPFVDLSLGLTSLGVNSHLLLKKNLKSTEKEIREVTKDKTNLIIYRDLDKEISSLNPEFIMTHDYSMNILKNFTKLKRVVYAQILFGFNSLNPHNMRNSMKFKVGSFVPWSILTRPYVNNINKFDYIIANSEFTRNLLLHLYNVISNGVVYPPVGTNLREYSDSVKVDDKDGMLIYLGHFPDYHIRNVFKEIEFIKNNENMTIRVVADTRENINIKGTELYSGLTSEALAHLYAKSSVTYIPTVNEMFGHVGAESLMFMTPVILDSYHPFLEFFPTDAVRISDSKQTIYEEYKNIIELHPDMKKAKNLVMERYSPIESAKRLMKITG